MHPNLNRRKANYVDKGVQGAILRRIVTHWILFLVAGGVLLFFVELVSGEPRSATSNMLKRHGPTALAVLVLTPILIRDLCKLTNRFVGPIVSLRRAMHELAEGNRVSPIQFRVDDFWQELANDFNRLAASIERGKPVEQRESDEPS
jgi:hypothetical protein